jgi:hypothetical protein
LKKENLNSISLIIADNWKLKFYNHLMIILEETINQGEIMKKLMKNNDFKKYGSKISMFVNRILRNIGKYPKFTISSDEEFQFFNEIKSIIESKHNCKVDIIFEKDSDQQKANQALPGKPAIVIS